MNTGSPAPPTPVLPPTAALRFRPDLPINAIAASGAMAAWNPCPYPDYSSSMALRITQMQLEPELPSPEDQLIPQGEEPRMVNALIQRAAVSVRSGDTAGYLKLFADAAAVKDEQLRYTARKLLVEQALAVTAQISERQAAALFLAAAHGVIGALEESPAEPVLLNYAGIALYELWSLEGARALFKAAQRLDPNLVHVERNLKALSSRGRSQGPRKASLHPALRTLNARAVQLARRAKPATGLKLSLCMIVRDEEEMLPRSLRAAAPAVDEIVVVDTGSQDRTLEIARSFGAKIIERAWTGSFSEARNAGLDAASGDWIIYLDADEVLVSDDVEKLRALCGQTWREAFFLTETNYTGSETAGTAIQHSALRVFRNRPQYRFRGRLHEQMGYALPGQLPERLTESGVRVEHYGYLGVVRAAKDKSRRNLEILTQQLKESPPDAFMHFNLGAEYAALEDYTAALPEYEESWRLAEIEGSMKLEFLPSLASRTVLALRMLRRPEDSIKRAESFLERFPDFTDLVYYQGLAAQDLGRDDEVAHYMNKAITMGDGPSRYTALVGSGTFLPRIVMALMYINRRNAQQALPLIEWCADHHPDFFGVMEPYAIALLRSGHSGAETVTEVESRLGKLSRTQHFMLGTALFEAGAAAQAEAQFRAVIAAQPHSGPARAALVEALLYQRQYEQAATEAAILPEDNPLAVAVTRSELFALLLARDLDGAALALTKAARVGLPLADQRVYRGWLALLRGQPLVPLPAAAAPLMELMLESLLRVQDFKSFELVLELHRQLELPERERREQLAQIYLRRGFIKSAAREWLAVCRERADPRALTGLVRVALANGQNETAQTFATRGLALDPTNESLRELLASIQSR